MTEATTPEKAADQPPSGHHQLRPGEQFARGSEVDCEPGPPGATSRRARVNSLPQGLLARPGNVVIRQLWDTGSGESCPCGRVMPHTGGMWWRFLKAIKDREHRIAPTTWVAGIAAAYAGLMDAFKTAA